MIYQRRLALAFVSVFALYGCNTAPAPQTQPVSDTMKTYAEAMGRAIGRNLRLSDEILRSQSQRTVVMSMTIDRQGRLIEAIVEEGSGLSSIDQASLTAVRSAAPFWNLPDDYVGEALQIRMPLQIGGGATPPK